MLPKCKTVIDGIIYSVHAHLLLRYNTKLKVRLTILNGFKILRHFAQMAEFKGHCLLKHIIHWLIENCDKRLALQSFVYVYIYSYILC